MNTKTPVYILNICSLKLNFQLIVLLLASLNFHSYSQKPIFELRNNTIDSIFQNTSMYTKNGALSSMISNNLSKKLVLSTLKHFEIANSVLKEGKIFKFRIANSSVYSISYSKLAELGFSSPANVKLYGNGGKQLSYMNSDARIADLQQIPVKLINNSLYFYLEGSINETYNSFSTELEISKNQFSSNAYYYFVENTEARKLIESVDNSEIVTEKTITEGTKTIFHEKNENNLIKSGRKWFGESFKYLTSYDYNFERSFAAGSQLLIKGAAAVRAGSSSALSVSAFNQNQYADYSPVDLNSYEGRYARYETFSFSYTAGTGNSIPIKISYLKPNSSAEAWLDYFTVQYKQKITYTAGIQSFWHLETGLTTKNIAFSCAANKLINAWQVDSLHSVKEYTGALSGSNYSFKYANFNSAAKFVLFSETDAQTIDWTKEGGFISNQNLHGLEIPDMLIITHQKFYAQAKRLAEFHASHDQLKVLVLTPELIYNEFSSGMPDVAALRDFVKMFYDRSKTSTKKIKYLLLFGDGSYDNSELAYGSKYYIPTYQSEVSDIFTGSYTTDDFFGLLDDSEGEALGDLDIGIGRYPVNTEEQAKNMVDKVIAYSNSDPGNWQTNICFLADDADDSTIHMEQADELANQAGVAEKSLVVKKIYADAYRQISTSQGSRYPDVNAKLKSEIENGSILINYTGHGSENGLGEEKMVTISDIRSWKNPNKLPVFVTATCEFSRYDDHELVSGGEEVLLNKYGGGIALFSTTRLVYSSPNFTLNQFFYTHALSRNENGERLRLGDIIRKTKNDMYYGTNKLNFALLGNPAIKINLPELTIAIDSINGSEIQKTDTLRALQTVKICGSIQDSDQQTVQNFNGFINPTVFDKAYTTETLGNDQNIPMHYTQSDNILYKGNAKIENGRFCFTFKVPKDINYTYGKGKIVLVGFSEKQSASGAYENIVIGGTSTNYTEDNEGPEIGLFLNHKSFVEGGKVGENPTLLVDFSDLSGINTSGTGIGHNITLQLDNEIPTVLNEYYKTDWLDFTKGSLQYNLKALPQGSHTLSVKAWDVLNNSSTKTITFYVEEAATFRVNELSFFPNPAIEYTNIYFAHNQEGYAIDLTVSIYTSIGKEIEKIVFKNQYFDGNIAGPFELRFENRSNFPNGLYFCKFEITSESGAKTIIGKNFVLNR
ncbi:MAG TPA: hypothetical protein DCQ31_09725 [Bacteroidales bacterium]|nr:hypothetical protein [Bacteroidales bacterium]